jgi:hypothetical protein
MKQKVWTLKGGRRAERAVMIAHDPMTGKAKIRVRGRTRTMEACHLQLRRWWEWK